MDLTRIVLPTFILERRSLLEMYADFFAHPDIFTDIAVKATPEERMVQVLRWYLSSFSASRKSTVAKKPYNPIIGMLLRLYWKLLLLYIPCYRRNIPSLAPPLADKVTAPIPWSAATDLVFLAEQVSHHPPVSAFYAECQARNISFTGHIYTKSAFLGLSVAVSVVLVLVDFFSSYFQNINRILSGSQYWRGPRERAGPRRGLRAHLPLRLWPLHHDHPLGGARRRRQDLVSAVRLLRQRGVQNKTVLQLRSEQSHRGGVRSQRQEKCIEGGILN